MLLVLAALSGLSAVWYVSRPAIVRSVARSNIGCDGHTQLLAAAIAMRYPKMELERFTLGGGLSHANVDSFGDCAQGFLTWYTQDPAPPMPLLVGSVPLQTLVLADQELNLLGRIQHRGWFSAEPLLAEHGAETPAWLVSYETSQSLSGRAVLIASMALVKFDRQQPAVAGLILIHSPRAHPWPSWTDSDGDGRYELTLDVRTYGRLPSGAFGITSTVTVASFELDEQGIPRPRQVPSDGSVLLWTPPDGQPVPVPADMPIEDSCGHLLPIPADF